LRGCEGLEINFSNSFALNKISFLPLHPLLEQGNRKAKKRGAATAAISRSGKGLYPVFDNVYWRIVIGFRTTMS